ncbi:MFS transporter [Geobacillus vulcani]|uniref:MFS transporter n=1 Tax=Geobacillus vulcani TaxID=135517 RepID=UPI0004DF9E45
MKMRQVNALEVAATSKFNKFHLMVYLWCFFAITFDGYDIALYGVSLPLLMKEWNLTVVQAGAIGSYSLIGMIIGALVFAPLADKIGRKKVLIICMTIFSIFTFLGGVIDSPIAFTIMRFIAALGIGGLPANAISLMTEYSPKANRTIIVATMYCGYSIGGILVSLLGIYAVPEVGWRILYWVGGFPLLVLPFLLKQFPESLSFYILKRQTKKLSSILNRINPLGDYTEEDDYCFEEIQNESKGFPVKKLFEKQRAISTFAFWIAVFSCLLMVYGLNTWLPKIMQQSGYGLSSGLVFNIVLCIGQVAGSLIGGFLAGKLGHRKVLVSMYILGAVCFVILGATSNLFMLYVLVAMGGACTVGTQNLANPYISEYYPKEARATGIGWALGVGRIGAVVAPTLIALILAVGLAPQKTFMVFAVPSIIGALALLCVQERFGSFDNVGNSSHLKQLPSRVSETNNITL